MKKLVTGSLLSILVLLCFLSDLSAARDPELEHSIAEKLTRKLNYGEAVWLGRDKNRFIGLFYDAYPSHHGDAAILLHGMGAHPDWPDVISPLRDALPRRQIATLSIQLPILTSDTNVADYGWTLKPAANRIRQAIEFLRDRGFQQIILIGFNFGASTAANYLANESQPGIDGFIAISILARKFLRPKVDVVNLLQGIRVPILDIYAEMDHAVILNGIADRRLAASISGNHRFRQLEIKKAQYDYNGYEHQLVNEITEWINKLHTDADPLQVK